MGERFDVDAFVTWVRRKIEDLENAMERIRPASVDNGATAFLLKTSTKTTYPTVAGRFYWCEVQKVVAVPTEGSAGTVSGTGSFLYARNLGGAIPPAGTLVIGIKAGNFTFRYD